MFYLLPSPPPTDTTHVKLKFSYSIAIRFASWADRDENKLHFKLHSLHFTYSFTNTNNTTPPPGHEGFIHGKKTYTEKSIVTEAKLYIFVDKKLLSYQIKSETSIAESPVDEFRVFFGVQKMEDFIFQRSWTRMKHPY